MRKADAGSADGEDVGLLADIDAIEAAVAFDVADLVGREKIEVGEALLLADVAGLAVLLVAFQARQAEAADDAKICSQRAGVFAEEAFDLGVLRQGC